MHLINQIYQMITRKYRITSRRFDDRGKPTTYSEPSFEGYDVAICDEKAKTHFNGVTAEPANQWAHICLRRIDAPSSPGPERTTFLADVREPSCDDALDLVG